MAEGDRKAFLESSKAIRKQNEETINDLRKKNKHMAARLKALKARQTRHTHSRHAYPRESGADNIWRLRARVSGR